MIQLLLLIVSFGSLLLLLMPATAVGILSTGLLGVIGIGLLIYKKNYRYDFRKNTDLFLLFTAFFSAAYCCLIFYDRWVVSSKVRAVASMLHVSKKMLILCASVVLSLLSIYFLCFFLHILIEKLRNLNRKNHFAGSLLSCLLASGLAVSLSQIMIGTETIAMGYPKFLLGILTVLIVILLLYCLIGKANPAIIIASALFLVISTVNVYVFKFRERLFEPVDVFSAGTAMNVADNYNLLPIPLHILMAWCVFAIMIVILVKIKNQDKPKLSVKRRLMLLGGIAVSLAVLFLSAPAVKTYHWKKQPAQRNGYILDFVCKFREITVSQPEGYSTEAIAGLEEQYANVPNEEAKQPHIIVIMDEAFSDLRVLGDFTTNKEVMPFISSLKENTISGYTLTSVYGGNTANSEYEFLTGNSMAWLSPNAVPFQQYVRSSAYSMVSYLKTTYDYRCIAMHPYLSSGWNRPAAYDNFGFDETHFIEDFPKQNLIRQYVSDREMFDFLIETFETQKQNPLFLFGVTMQNHGGYTYTGDNYTQHIFLEKFKGEYPEVEQYLSLIYETDIAVEYLISYFENVEEDVVILFYGDHQPKTPEAFYTDVCGIDMDNLDEKQKTYMVPFFIWANYDIEEAYIDCTSLNFLPGYVYDAAGIPLPPYHSFLRELEEITPAMNANGFYSPAAGGYLPFDMAGETEQNWLDTYEMLQYNNIFDEKQRNASFFPTLE